MSNTQEKKIENVSIGRCALFGAVGFGVGTITILAVGAIGGAALGLALRDRRKTIRLALYGGVGFLIGAIIGFSGAETFGDLIPIVSRTGTMVTIVYLGGPLFSSTVWGAVGGAALGLALWDLKKAIILALAGALGFGIGGVSSSFFMFYLAIINVVLMGIIGGAFLGATLGYLEKGETANQSTSSGS